MWCGTFLGVLPATSDGGGGSDCPTVSQIWAHQLPNGKSARSALAEASDLLGEQIQGAYTVADVLRILAAVAAGKTTILSLGGGAATVTFDAIDGSGPVVEADMQGSERTNVTLTPEETT